MNERDIFIDALGIENPDDLRAFLDQACEGDSSLRERVEALLHSHDKGNSFLERPPAVLAQATIDQPIAEQPGDTIGPYKLLQKIGEGGMGVVYMAEQTEPVERRVALKIIKPGMDTRQVIARFEAERQALAMMDHPNIAKVLDAGTTDTGRPYFVMELVKGIPVTQYCDEKQLTPRERLELFVPICQAAQHAHQKGIIHRDIKPSNVLVAEYDDRAVPKIIDFGVAKAIEKHLTEKTVFTEFGQVVGTIEYMSPEQAKLNQLDIDTRTDIYSLGVLLYELLTGETPFDPVQLRSAAFDEMLRIIREEEPPRPSLKLSTSESLLAIAANRHVEPKKLGTLVHGELDWIVMKALEKDRCRRYETASKFAEDVEHYLHDEAVSACPPSAAYRFRKFARRNKVAIAMAAATTALLLLGIAGTSWQAVRASQAETDARSEAVAAVRERQRTKTLLARMQLERGVEALNSEDLRGLLDLVEASAAADENPDLRAAIGRLWAIAQQGAKGRLVHVFPSNRETIAFSPDGKLLATAHERQAQLWDLATGEAVGPPLPLERPVYQVLFSPNGDRLATVAREGVARLWVVQTQEPVGPPLRHEPLGKFDWFFQWPAAFSPDGKLLATGALYGSVQLWDATTGAPHGEPILPEHPLTALAFNPDGRLLATGAEDGVLQLWDVETGKPRGQPMRHPLPEDKSQKVIRIVFSPDGKLVAVAYETDASAVWEVKTGELHSLPALLETPARGWLIDLALSPDSKRLATASTDWTALLWDVDTGKTIGSPMQHDSRVTSVDFAADGKLLATGSYDGTLGMWDVNSGVAHGPPLRQGGRVGRVLFSPDMGMVASAGLKDVRIWRVDRKTESALRHVASLRKTALSPDGRYRAKITPQNTVEVTDVATGQAVIDPIHHGIIVTVAFSPDSRLMATGSLEFTADIWEVATGRLRQTLWCPDRVYAVAFSSDGKTLATGSRDGKIQLWDYARGKKHGFPMQHKAHIRLLAFSPDGQWLVSLAGCQGRPGKLWFWDVTTGPDYLGLGVPHLTLAPDEQFETFNLDGSLMLADGNGKSRRWVLPQASSELREMRLATWVALGLEKDLMGRMQPISGDKWRSLRQELNAYRQAKAERLIKPKEMTENAEKEELCTTQLAADHQESVELRLTLGFAHTRLGNVNLAAEDFAAALDLKPNGKHAEEALLRELAGQGDVLSRLADLRPINHDLWIRQGRKFAKRGEWQTALDYYTPAVPPEKVDGRKYELACLLLLTGQDEQFDQLCRQLIDSVKHVSRPSSNGRIMTLTLRDQEGLDPEQLIRWAESNLEKKKDGLSRYGLGCAYYRAGSYTEAVKTLTACSEQQDATGRYAAFPLALALRRLNKPAESRHWEQVGRGALTSMREDPGPWAAAHVLTLNVWGREMEAVAGQQITTETGHDINQTEK